MGSCVSFHKHSDSTAKQASKAKVASIDAGAKSFISSDPDKSGSGAEDYDAIKEETFYDSRAWLDSDTEDDFYSVHGDFTPSRGSTPNYQRSAPGTPQLNKEFFSNGLPESNGESSPLGNKMKLFEFFKETLQAESFGDSQSTWNESLTTRHHPPDSVDVAFHKSIPNSALHEKDSNGYLKPGTEKKIKGGQCCLPTFTHRFELGERKQLKSIKKGRKLEKNNGA